MNTKLTLTINEDVISKAKAFAKSQNSSLSGIIENYLKSLTNKNTEDRKDELTPITKSLRGAFKNVGNIDYKEERMKRLEEKYL